MTNKKTLLGGFLALALILAAAGLLLYFSLKRLNGLNPNVAAAIVAALAAVVGAIYTQHQSRLRQLEEAHRGEKVALYNIYMDIIDYLIQLSREDRLKELSGKDTPKTLEDLFRKLRRGLLVWASPQVVKEYQSFRLASGASDVLLHADDVFRAIRRDLRINNSGLVRGDLIKLFLRDPSELDRALSESQQKPTETGTEGGSSSA